MKALIYFIINYDYFTVKLWKLTMKSLIKYSNLTNVDILVITNKTFYKPILRLTEKSDIKIHMILHDCPDNTLLDSRLRRLEIFDVYNITKYDVVMHMDYDCIVQKCIWENIFKKYISQMQDNKIYSYTEEKNNKSSYNKLFYSFQSYSHKEIRKFQKNNANTFSSGVFMFKPSKKMNRVFKDMYNFIISNLDIRHFYEQSGMNVYAHDKMLVDTELLSNIIVSRNIKPNKHGNPKLHDYDIDIRNVIVHFCGIGFVKEKEDRMREYYRLVRKINPCLN
jgi:hypothetical protein